MLTTVTPGAQELSMASSAATPPRDAPYPTLVGTATSGTPFSPPTTDGSAPSIPATTTRQSAAASRSRTPSSRCRPATPTSSIRSTPEPCTRTVSAASAATGASDVPALTTATVPRAVGSGPRVTARATGSIPASGRARATDASASSDSRVASTARSGCRSCRVRRIVTTCSGVLPAPYTTSGSPVRAARSTSTRAKPRFLVRGSCSSTRGTYSAGVVTVGGRVLSGSMATFERYAQGTPSYVELVTPDQAGAKEFYGPLFGWELEDVPLGPDVTYVAVAKEGDQIAG